MVLNFWSEVGGIETDEAAASQRGCSGRLVVNYFCGIIQLLSKNGLQVLLGSLGNRFDCEVFNQYVEHVRSYESG